MLDTQAPHPRAHGVLWLLAATGGKWMWPTEPKHGPEKEGLCLWLCPLVQRTRHGRTERHETADNERSRASQAVLWGPSHTGNAVSRPSSRSACCWWCKNPPAP